MQINRFISQGFEDELRIHQSLSFIFNDQFVKLSFSILNEFIIYLFTLLSSSFNLVCIQLYFNVRSLQQKFQVDDLFSGVVFKPFEEYVANAIIRQENKRHILGRSDKEIFEGKVIIKMRGIIK